MTINEVSEPVLASGRVMICGVVAAEPLTSDSLSFPLTKLDVEDGGGGG